VKQEPPPTLASVATPSENPKIHLGRIKGKSEYRTEFKAEQLKAEQLSDKNRAKETRQKRARRAARTR